MIYKMNADRPKVDAQAVLDKMDYLYDADYLDLIDAFADDENENETLYRTEAFHR